MMNRLFSIFFILLLLSATGNPLQAQKKNQAQFLKIYWDDDFFNLRGEGTDRGYSSGLKIDYFYTKNGKAKFPSNLLMKVTENADNLYGWGISNNIYTPNDIKATDIQYGDRPYAGSTYFTHTLVSSDNVKKQKLTTSFSIGALGKYSFSKEIQTWVHGVINYQKPQGWDNQIKSDVIVNYSVNYERLLFSPSVNLELLGNVEGNAGTLVNNMGLGLQFRAGKFFNYFSNYERPTFKGNSNAPAPPNRFQFFFYMKTNGVAVMDDATLQGGFFSHNQSPYRISKDSINRFYMQYEYGIVIANKRVGFVFAEKIRTPEFKRSYAEQIGNLTFYIGL